MNAITIGSHVINLDALAWADLAFQWQTAAPQYEEKNGLRGLTGTKHETHTGIYLAFVGGLTLTLQDGTSGINHLRAALSQSIANTQTDDEAYNPTESGILSALPADLRDLILKLPE